MTILFAGGEDTSFTFFGTVTLDTISFRTGYARHSLFMNGGASDPPANRMVTPAFSASAVVWVHYQAQPQVGSGTVNSQGLIVRSPDGVGRIYIRQTATTGQLKVDKRDAATTFTNLFTAAGATFTTGSVHALDLKINYVASGEVSLWIDGSQVGTFSGDPRTDAATTLNQVDFSSLQTGNVWHSEIIVGDEDTRGMALWTIAPVAAGNTQSWTPNTVGNINDQTINDATLVSTTNNNDLSQWTTPVSAPSGSWGVKAIVQEARVRVGTTGPQHFDWSLRTASTDYTAGTSNAPSTSFGNFNNQRWATNPNTSGSWSITDIASGFNLGIKSLA